MRFFTLEMNEMTAAKRKEVTYVVGDLAEVIVRPNNVYAASNWDLSSYEEWRRIK